MSTHDDFRTSCWTDGCINLGTIESGGYKYCQKCIENKLANLAQRIKTEEMKGNCPNFRARGLHILGSDLGCLSCTNYTLGVEDNLITPQNINTKEKFPVPNEEPYVIDMVIEDMKSRSEFGFRKYGTKLQIHNGRNALTDLRQEMYDAVVYYAQLSEELKCLGKDLLHLRAQLVGLKCDDQEIIVGIVTFLDLVLKRNPVLCVE